VGATDESPAEMEATVQESPAKENKVRIQVGRALFLLDLETVGALTTAFLSRLLDPESAFVNEIQGRSAEFFSALVHMARLKNGDTPTMTRLYREAIRGG
jgi:hypothetical protein